MIYVDDKKNFIEYYEAEILDKILAEYLNERLFMTSKQIELVCNDPIKIILDYSKCKSEVKHSTAKDYLLSLLLRNHKNNIN